MAPKKRANKQTKAAAAAPLRMTRSRAASQGLELPDKFDTPPDKVRRSRKASKSSKSSQGSIPVIAETVELDAPAEAPIVIIASDDDDQVGIQEPGDEELPSSPLDRKTPFLSSPLGTPENESTPIHALGLGSSLAKSMSIGNTSVIRNLFKPVSSNPVPCTRAAAPSPSPPPQQPSETKLPESIVHEGSVYTETSIIFRRQLPSPSPLLEPKPGSKRRRAKSHQSPGSDSDADSEDNHAHILTYADRPPPASRGRRRPIQNLYAKQNNPKEEAARRIRMQRIEDFNRQMLEQEHKTATTERAPKRIKISNGYEQPPHLESKSTSDSSVPDVPQSAPTTPNQRGSIFAPLLNSASNIFNFWGSRSAAPRFRSQKPTAIKDEFVAPSTASIPMENANPLESNGEQAADEPPLSPTNPFKSAVDDSVASRVIDSPLQFRSAHRRPSRTNVRHNMQERKRHASEGSLARSASPSESDQDSQRNNPRPTKSRKLESGGLMSGINSQRHYQDEAEDFEPDDSPSHGNKRKLGKTFSVPEMDSASDSEANDSEDLAAESDLYMPSSSKQAPEDQFTSSVNIHNVFSKSRGTSPDIKFSPEPEERVGRTYSMPESNAISNSDGSWSELDFPLKHKPMTQWTSSDMKDYMRLEHDWDPQKLADEVPDMLKGHLPSMFAKARHAIKLMRAKAEDELEAEMRELRHVRLAQLDEDVRQRRREIDQLELNILRRRDEWRVLQEKEAHDAAVRHQHEVQNGTPETDSTVPNIFATANGGWAQAPPSSPTPSHAQLPGTPAPKPNISWAENNKTNHITSPGPNEPPKYSSTPLITTKSALKGANGVSKPTIEDLASQVEAVLSEEAPSGLTDTQRASYERRRHDLTKYTPKKPSRLREVSRLSSSPAVAGGKVPATPGDSVDPVPTATDSSIIDTTMNTVSDLVDSPNRVQADLPSSPFIDYPSLPPHPVARAAAWAAIQAMPKEPISEYGPAVIPFGVDLSIGIPPDELAFRKQNLVMALGLKA